MALYLDINALSTSSLSVIKTDNGKPAYILTGRHGLINGGFDLNTLSGEPLGSIRQKTVSVFPRYDLYIANRKVASVKKMFGVWHQFIFISDLNWVAMGNLLNNHYQVFHGVKTIFSAEEIAPAIVKLTIPNNRDIPAAILLAAILDRFRHVGVADPLKRYEYGLDFPD